MPHRNTGRQLGLFDNPVGDYTLEELAAAVRDHQRRQPGQTAAEITAALFDQLAIKRTRRASDLVSEAIRIARPRQPRPGITSTRWQASTSEVRQWAASQGFQVDPDQTIPAPAIAAYNQTHPDRPY